MNEEYKLNTNFLLIEHSKIDFLISRSQVFASIFLYSPQKIESNLRYLSYIIEYKNQKLLLLELSKYLEEAFNIESKDSSNLVLIIQINVFSESNRDIVKNLYKNICSYLGNDITSDYVALRVSSNIGIKNVSTNELEDIPLCIRKFESLNGVVALRFIEGSKIQYLIDIENIIIHKLLSKNI